MKEKTLYKRIIIIPLEFKHLKQFITYCAFVLGSVQVHPTPPNSVNVLFYDLIQTTETKFKTENTQIH